MISYQSLKKSAPFFLIAGPCAVENEETCFHICEKILEITSSLGIPYIFKASYKKANRSRLDSFTGIGNENALSILRKVKEKFGVAITTDIHEPSEAAWAAEVADILQIPAFLCRQTDLLVAASKTDKIVNIKKGQFLSPESMKFAVDKIIDSGNTKTIVTERGTFLGYSDLVVDFRGIPVMKSICNSPVVMDCTHSLQQPNQTTGITGGRPEMIETIAKAAIAVGADGLFIETHPNPAEAKSDGANMLALKDLKNILAKVMRIRESLQ